MALPTKNNGLILGTAEFNPEGYAGKPCPSEKEIAKILNLAYEAGVRTLDCAEAYHNDLKVVLDRRFHLIWKTRERITYRNAYYHYKQNEKRIDGITHASVYTLEQLDGLQSAIVPLNIHDKLFLQRLYKYPLYLRSVFKRGILLEEGYSINECLDFVKRVPNDGVIVGVNSAKELKEILKVW